jgi:ParB family chromosome partitioning protein
MDSQAEAAPDYSDLVEGVITTIPLDRLMLSTLNVRQTERAADIESLAEDIGARGLKQNLVVIPAHFVTGEPGREHMDGEPHASGGKNVWDGRFEVIAGGRRFQAMQLLVQQERLSPTFPVPCMVEYRDAASETSLSENLHRVAMNPADEFEAFRVIVEQARKNGSAEDPIAYCAKRFGVTVKHVNGRLRLASLAPEILAALRANEIGIESAKAYAGVEDHALQLKVFEQQKKSNWQAHNPAAVRGALRDKTLSVNDGMVKFVGVDAYVAAGGRIETEMFMGSEGQERIVDIKLLEKLAKDAAEPLVAPQAKKDGFKSGLLASGVGNAARWPNTPEGMERYNRYYDQKDPTKAELKKCVAVYAIDVEGAGVSKIGHFRTPPCARRGWSETGKPSAQQAPGPD